MNYDQEKGLARERQILTKNNMHLTPEVSDCHIVSVSVVVSDYHIVIIFFVLIVTVGF